MDYITIITATNAVSAMEHRCQMVINISTAENRVVRVLTDSTADVIHELSGVDGSCQTRNGVGAPYVDVWGANEDGDTWRLHLYLLAKSGERGHG